MSNVLDQAGSIHLQMYDVSGLVIDCCLMPNEQFLSYIMARTSYIRWDDDDVHFVQEQHA